MDFPWNQLEDDRPFVYASLGSQVFHQPRIFASLVVAARDEPHSLVISAGDLAAAISGRGALATPYAPQLALLPRAAAMVTHGGANSVMEALSSGVPLLVTPICNDQPHNARFVEQSGAGIALDLQSASVAERRAALRALVAAGPHREAAARVAASYATRDGAVIAADRALDLGA